MTTLPAGLLRAALAAGGALLIALNVATAAPARDKLDAPAAEAPRKHPRPQNRDRTQNLDFLFGALKAAPDAEAAKLVENRIEALWLASGSDTADLLMSRVKTAVDAKDNALALRLLDSIIELKPDFAEAWNRRATLHFMEKDITAAILDLRQVLAREPRHFGALVGLGLIMQQLDEDKRALDLFRRALDIHPHLPRIPDLIQELSVKVEGRPI